MEKIEDLQQAHAALDILMDAIESEHREFETSGSKRGRPMDDEIEAGDRLREFLDRVQLP